MIPLISFDAVVNIYLTIIFLIPLRSMWKSRFRLPDCEAEYCHRTSLIPKHAAISSEHATPNDCVSNVCRLRLYAAQQHSVSGSILCSPLFVTDPTWIQQLDSSHGIEWRAWLGLSDVLQQR